MKSAILSLLILFTVTVKVPWGVKKVYTDVRRIDLHASGFVYTLQFTNGKKAYVPSQWTIIEEAP